MSQTNYTPISLYYTTVSGRPVPAGTLIPGELALNAADGTLFYYNTTNTAIQQITVGSASTATNLAGGTTGSLPYQSGAGATTFLGIGAANTVLTSSGTAPQYVAQSTLSVGTATNLAGGLALEVPFQTAAGTTTFTAAPSVSGQVLTYNGTTLTWATAGTSGVSSFSAGTTGFTPNTATTGAVTLAGTLNVANGGTGATSLTANNVILGNGTSAVQTVAPGASGNVLTSDGTTWISAAAGGGGGSITLISTQTITVPTTAVEWTGLSGYDSYMLVVTNPLVTSGDGTLIVQIGTGATPTYLTSGYYTAGLVIGSSATNYGSIILLTNASFSSYSSGVILGYTAYTSVSKGISETFFLNGMISDYFSVTGTSAMGNAGGYSSGGINSQNTATAIRLADRTGGTMTSGTFSLYGISS